MGFDPLGLQLVIVEKAAELSGFWEAMIPRAPHEAMFVWREATPGYAASKMENDLSGQEAAVDEYSLRGYPKCVRRS
ncbi:MAG: hypothetical protein MI924_15490 [Chloroflexales bacterium]|nr:hypothetical protein [Chloroflexales bacterium]